VPLFSQVDLTLNQHKIFTIHKKNSGLKIDEINVENQKLDGYFLSHDKLAAGGKMVITTQ
jgi:putative alpha-1,2-mannosidase